MRRSLGFSLLICPGGADIRRAGDKFRTNGRLPELFEARFIRAKALHGPITPLKPLQMNPTMQLHQSRQNGKRRRLTRLVFGLYVFAFAILGRPAVAQPVPGGPSDLWREPVLPRGLAAIGNVSTADFPSCMKGTCCRLFRMPTGIPSEPVGLDTDTDPVTGDVDAIGLVDRDASGDGRLKVAVGADNPFFDFRRPSDPGGVGFYRLHSQVLLFDNQKTGLTVGLQAVTPAGLEADGVADGPTILSPHFAWFHQVGNGTAIQGFVGKDLRANSHWSDSLDRQINYGVALQSPFPGTENTPGRSVHLFLEALGRYRIDGDPSLRSPLNWEVLPGVHWQLGDNWWMSGGILMPLGTARPDARLWQITCSWQF